MRRARGLGAVRYRGRRAAHRASRSRRPRCRGALEQAGTQLQVLLDPARQVTQPAVTEQSQLAIRDPLKQVAVVRDDDERADPPVEQILERGQGVDIQVVGRFVQEEDVGFIEKDSQDLEPAALPS